MGVDVPRGAMRRPERAAYLTVAAALCPLTALWASHGGPAWGAEAPMAVATTLVAVVGNASAVQRLRAIARSLRVRDTRPLTPLHRGNKVDSLLPSIKEDEAKMPGAAPGRSGPGEARRAASG
jgi:hypothetical protein